MLSLNDGFTLKSDRKMTGSAQQKTKMDVEKLLHWAYRDELPKGFGGGGSFFQPSDISPMFRVADLGTRVDDWSREPGFPAAMGPPHPDALIVENVVGRLPDVGLDWRQSRSKIMGELAPYAPENHPALVYLSFQTAALVILHARMGTRPRWDMGPIKVKRRQGKNGKPVVQFLDDEGHLIDGLTAGRRYGPGSRCPVDLEPSGPDIAFARAEYAAWRSGLEAVKASLERWGLSSYHVTGPAVAAAPWFVDDERRSRILRAV